MSNESSNCRDKCRTDPVLSCQWWWNTRRAGTAVPEVPGQRRCGEEHASSGLHLPEALFYVPWKKRASLAGGHNRRPGRFPGLAEVPTDRGKGDPPEPWAEVQGWNNQCDPGYGTGILPLWVPAGRAGQQRIRKACHIHQKSARGIPELSGRNCWPEERKEVSPAASCSKACDPDSGEGRCGGGDEVLRQRQGLFPDVPAFWDRDENRGGPVPVAGGFRNLWMQNPDRWPRGDGEPGRDQDGLKPQDGWLHLRPDGSVYRVSLLLP